MLALLEKVGAAGTELAAAKAADLDLTASSFSLASESGGHRDFQFKFHNNFIKFYLFI